MFTDVSEDRSTSISGLQQSKKRKSFFFFGVDPSKLHSIFTNIHGITSPTPESWDLIFAEDNKRTRKISKDKGLLFGVDTFGGCAGLLSNFGA
jgi:hypothetical protein